MRTIIIPLLFCFIYLGSFAQTKKDPGCHLVKIKDWTSYSILVFDQIWENARQEIVDQIGENEFNYISKNYGNLPIQMRMYDGPNRITTAEELNSRLAKLTTLCKIAKFKHVINGQYFGNKIIVQVPFVGNENWDLNAKWEKAYFIFPERAVEGL